MYNNYKNYNSDNIGDSNNDNDDEDVVGKKKNRGNICRMQYTYVDIF